MFRPSFHPSAHQRAVGRNLAFDLVACDRGRGHGGPGHHPAADDRPPRRPRADRPRRPGGRAVRRQPAERLRRPRRPAVAAPARARPRRRAPRRCSSLAVVASAPVIIAVSFVFWLSLSISSPFQLRLWGSMYPARVRGRVVGVAGIGPGGRRGAVGARRRGRRRPARWPDGGRPGRGGRPRLRAGLRGPARARCRAASVVLRPRFDPRPARAARSSRGSPSPRGSTAAA